MTRALALIATAALGCAAPTPAVPPRFWPAPPARPLARWLGEFPVAPPRASTGRRVLGWLTGQPAPAPARAVLGRPFGVASWQGGFLVADPGRRQVLRVEWPGGRARPVACAGRDWVMPMAAVEVPGDGVLVAEAGRGVVVHVDPGGSCHDLGAGRLQRPTGLAVHAGRIFVVDPPRHRVVALSMDGEELAVLGDPDSRGDGLRFPTAVAVTPAGDVLVADTVNGRVVRFAEQRGAWVLAAVLGAPGLDEAGFGMPKGVAVDGAGRVFVSDARKQRVAVLSPTGAHLAALGDPDLSLPAGLCVHGTTLFVADAGAGRVQAYELLEGAP